jgi:hypothetical protein
VKVCEHLDQSLLDGCQRYKRDEEEVREILDLEKNAKEAETTSTLASLSR